METMKIVIVTPVFNDWTSFKKLSREIDASLASEEDVDYTMLVINDDSSVIPNLEDVPSKVRLLHLTCNLGHQRAIAVGLSHLADEEEFDAVIVMDADGEDKPSDLPRMLQAHRKKQGAIVVARRDKRSEGGTFRLGYSIYRAMFRLFTGKHLPFGNFSLIPSGAVRRLVYEESIWNHLAATILKSRFELVMLSTQRGQRYQGQSQMNLSSLTLLGLSAISVYSDLALLRTLIGSLAMSSVAVLGIFVTTYIRLFTDFAIPGWASDVVGSMAIILFQSLVLSVFLLFIVLSNRSQRGFVAARHYEDYVLLIEDFTLRK
ncbi:MAG: glycosyltransferase [Pseudomonadales bacterium]|nr:glycosyltransferase [Pseudomonadales bacterium]